MRLIVVWKNDDALFALKVGVAPARDDDVDALSTTNANSAFLTRIAQSMRIRTLSLPFKSTCF